MNDLFIQGLTIDWNRVRPYNYVRQIPAISGIDTFTFHKPITFFVGENGSGKSTLLEAIAVAYGFNAEGGTKNYSFSTYNSHSELCEAMTISKGYRRPKFGYFLRAESFYNVATKEIDYSDDDHPSKGYHQKSHGESFLAIAQDYMGADGVYIFDEPEAALSPQRQLTLLINIYRCAQEGRNSLSYHIHPFSSECLMLRFLASTMARFILVSMKIRTATLSPKHL